MTPREILIDLIKAAVSVGAGFSTSEVIQMLAPLYRREMDAFIGFSGGLDLKDLANKANEYLEWAEEGYNGDCWITPYLKEFKLYPFDGE